MLKPFIMITVKGLIRFQIDAHHFTEGCSSQIERRNVFYRTLQYDNSLDAFQLWQCSTTIDSYFVRVCLLVLYCKTRSL